MNFNSDGNLPPGIYILSWEEFYNFFNFSPRRIELLEGLKSTIDIMARCGCTSIYIDGSFVTSKLEPNDWDACFDCPVPKNLYLDAINMVFPLLNKKMQKKCFKGEIYPSWLDADGKNNFIDFFQQVKNNERKKKGIIQILLENDTKSKTIL